MDLSKIFSNNSNLNSFLIKLIDRTLEIKDIKKLIKKINDIESYIKILKANIEADKEADKEENKKYRDDISEREIETYNKKLNDSITNLIFNGQDVDTIDKLKTKITTIEQYINDVKAIIEDKNKIDFFEKSLEIKNLKKTLDEKYTTDESITNIIHNNKELEKASENSLYTIFIYKYNDIENLKYIKIVPYYDTVPSDIKSKPDCIIFDIINGYIFNLIFSSSSGGKKSKKIKGGTIPSLNTHQITIYSKHVSKYEYSFLSYYYDDKSNNKKIWNYEELSGDSTEVKTKILSNELYIRHLKLDNS